jgi:hypothetical protein
MFPGMLLLGMLLPGIFLAGCAQAPSGHSVPAGSAVAPSSSPGAAPPAIREPTDTATLAEAFADLERGDGLPDPDARLREVMGAFRRYLAQSESLRLTSQAFREMSGHLQVFEVQDGMFFFYQGTPTVFGESGASGYAFLQVRSGDEPQVYAVFEAEPRQVWDVLAKGAGEALVYGVETGHPRQAFADRMRWRDGYLEKEPALTPHDDGKWRIDAGSGLVSRSDGLLVETYFVEMNESLARIGSSDGEQLALVWRDETGRFEVPQRRDE